MKMASYLKILFCSVLTIFLGNLNAQSKKEQILALSNKIDSLNSVLNNERDLSLEKIRKLNFKTDSIGKKLNATKVELSKVSKDCDRQKSENDSLSSGFKQLESELISLKEENTKLKLDSIRDNRFEKLDEVRQINVNNKPLDLFPFEMFDVMTFEGLSNTGLTESLDFKVQGSGEQISFYGDNNELEFDESKLWSDTDIILDKAIVLLKCDCDEKNIRRSLVKNREYKVIYSFKSDSELWRKPFPTESTDGYYIVDVLELNEQFEREKEKW